MLQIFKVKERSFESSSSDFALVTGLSFKPLPPTPTVSLFHNLIFDGRRDISFDEIRDEFSKECKAHGGGGELCFKLAMLVIVYGVILFHNCFTYDQLVEATHADRDSLDYYTPSSLSRPCIDACGYSYALQVWAYEIIPSIGQLCASRVLDWESKIPRVLCWVPNMDISRLRIKELFTSPDLQVLSPLQPVSMDEQRKLSYDEPRKTPKSNKSKELPRFDITGLILIPCLDVNALSMCARGVIIKSAQPYPIVTPGVVKFVGSKNPPTTNHPSKSTDTAYKGEDISESSDDSETSDFESVCSADDEADGGAKKECASASYNPRYTLGHIFSTKVVFKESINNYTVKIGRPTRFTKIDARMIYARCKIQNDGCEWHINALKVKNEDSFQIRELDLTNTCAGQYRVSNAKSGWLAQKYEKSSRCDPKRTMKLLKEDFMTEREDTYTFMPDKQKGLIGAFEKILPGVDNRFCVRHLHGNMKRAGSKDNHFKRLLWKVGNATTVAIFNSVMIEIESMDKNCLEWLQRDKEKPVLTMLEWIREYLMSRLQKIRDMIRLKESEKPSDTMYKVSSFDGSINVVNLQAHSCDCRQWDLSGIPCKHAISAIHAEGKLPEEYVHNCYSVETYMAVCKFYGEDGHNKIGCKQSKDVEEGTSQGEEITHHEYPTLSQEDDVMLDFIENLEEINGINDSSKLSSNNKPSTVQGRQLLAKKKRLGCQQGNKKCESA
ncbi:hypothetical protein C2S53_014804 [Perilla frutescens var. hirtella]|uniref:SWIM-type domain-containing protein n=1 Tax=Perilla frutescens var. hirtella TaxID=608512 RepID=A0AAD4IQC6_PERFH|nr:hypothetical protein C2S53_014804 [Perilla frutescens var. hirtella]